MSAGDTVPCCGGHLEADYEILRLLVENRSDWSVFKMDIPGLVISVGWLVGEYWWLPWKEKITWRFSKNHQHPHLWLTCVADVRCICICWTKLTLLSCTKKSHQTILGGHLGHLGHFRLNLKMLPEWQVEQKDNLGWIPCCPWEGSLFRIPVGWNLVI